MDDAIFRKLEDVILLPSRSKEWFGMAEQAINTIYALGEHPDTLCNAIIKALTRRVFAKAPRAKSPFAMDEDEPVNEDAPEGTPSGASSSSDTGDAFELSQLLFVVGHVAIKQIVYLELVEREWKRQKDEREKGILFPTIFSWIIHNHVFQPKRARRRRETHRMRVQRIARN